MTDRRTLAAMVVLCLVCCLNCPARGAEATTEARPNIIRSWHNPWIIPPDVDQFVRGDVILSIGIYPAKVCAVQHAIRWRDHAWDDGMCKIVTRAANETKDPTQSLARAINESDLVHRAIRLTLRPDGAVAADVGLQGVRCVLKGADARAAWRSVGVLTHEKLQQHPPRGRCTNGPARGLTIQQLQDPRINFEKSEQVFDLHGRDLGAYNGAKDPERQRAYRARIGAIEAALSGVEVKVSGSRLRKLVRQIVAAVRGGRRS